MADKLQIGVDVTYLDFKNNTNDVWKYVNVSGVPMASTSIKNV